MERNFKGIWIPKEIWLAENLTLQEKVILVEIDSFDNEERGCYASNNYFSKFFNISPSRISQIISSLVSKGYVSVLYIKENKEIKERQMHIKRPPYPEVFNKLNTYLENYKGGIKYSKGGYLENAKDNNINNNNINNNNINNNNINNKEELFFESDKLNSIFLEWLEYKKQRKEKYTDIGRKKLISRINKQVELYGEENIISLIEDCMASNYAGIIFDKLNKKQQNIIQQNKTYAQQNEERIERLKKELLEGE